ncbi:hypothetical protein ELS82_24050 [Vibrio ouci]|uniref:Uncharacterized protein n=1 Tax=Vibrio ouci TaxID=2499078 RepID=A0A4Y8W8G2_9VIBR|nr:hypothetical protein [Vibrio ouci]TFH89107.1 hypothetical protein ELS82_24050 [Vibrio ouci]
MTNFPAWPGQSIFQPMFIEKSALPISPTNLQLHKSALPISPPVGMAAAAPMSRPTVFFVDFADFVRAADSNTTPCIQTSIVSSALPLTILAL